MENKEKHEDLFSLGDVMSVLIENFKIIAADTKHPALEKATPLSNLSDIILKYWGTLQMLDERKRMEQQQSNIKVHKGIIKPS